MDEISTCEFGSVFECMQFASRDCWSCRMSSGWCLGNDRKIRVEADVVYPSACDLQSNQ